MQKRLSLLFPLFAIAMGASTTALTAGSVYWDYKGDHGPEYWPTYFPGCGGFNQSPVDIVGPVDAELPSLAMNYQPSSVDAVNNGHTVQYNYSAGSTLTVNGSDYELLQFHFHSPSENHVQGRSFPMEAHLVHKNADGALAVVAVLFDEGDDNPLLATLWESMPMEDGDASADEAASYNVTDLLPGDADYYRFSGSLTTPPCTEGVTWLVMKEPVAMGSEQLAKFRHAVNDHDTNRPIQALNARLVME